MKTNGTRRRLLVALASLKQQVTLLKVLFEKELLDSEISFPAIEMYVKRRRRLKRPHETRWVLTIPWQALTKQSYPVACSIVTSCLQRQYGESFKNYIPHTFKMDHLVLLDDAREGMDALVSQSGSTTPAFLMQPQVGGSIADILACPPRNKFMLDFVTVSLMLLVYPRLFAHNKQVWLDCGGTGFHLPGNEHPEDYVPSYTIKNGCIILDVIRVTDTQDVCTPLGIIPTF